MMHVGNMKLVHVVWPESVPICTHLTPDVGSPPKHVGSLIIMFLIVDSVGIL